MTDEAKRSTLPPPAPDPKTVIEAIGLVHAELDGVRKEAQSARGASHAAKASVDRLSGTVAALKHSIDSLCQVLQRVPILEEKVATHEAEIVLLKKAIPPTAAE